VKQQLGKTSGTERRRGVTEKGKDGRRREKVSIEGQAGEKSSLENGCVSRVNVSRRPQTGVEDASLKMWHLVGNQKNATQFGQMAH